MGLLGAAHSSLVAVREEQLEDAAQSVDVGTVVGGKTLQLFRCSELTRARRLFHEGVLAAVGETKIDELHRVVGVSNQDVGRLDVAVPDLLVVTIGHCRYQLTEYLFSLSC